MLKILFGNEPMIMKNIIENEKSQLTDIEFSYSSHDCLKDAISIIQNNGLFGSRLAVCTVDTLTELSAAYAVDTLDELADGTNENSLIIRVPEGAMDKRSKAYKKFQKFFLECGKEQIYPELQNKIRSAFDSADSYKEYINRVSFLDNPSYVAQTVLDEVVNLQRLVPSRTISLDMVKAYVKNYVAEDVFNISSYLVAGDMKKVMEQYVLPAHKIALFSALFYELQVAYKSKYFPLSEIGGKENPFCSLSKESIKYLLGVVTETTQEIKSSNMEALTGEHGLVKMFVYLHPEKEVSA